MSDEMPHDDMAGGRAAGNRAGFVALIGEPNAGKSTLLNKMVGPRSRS